MTTRTPGAIAPDRYRVERLLGEGTRKRVYLAHDEVLGRRVALAVLRTNGLDDVALAHLRDEARAMARLGTHPHVVTVYDLGEYEGRLHLSMEYVDGGELRAHIDACGSGLPIDEVVRLTHETAHALAHAHERGVLHRDLNPGNVWLTADGHVKVGDFGFAVSLARLHAVRDGTLITAVAYLAPEIALGARPSPASDLYALGAMLYELLTGHPPHRGDDAVAVLSQHIHTAPVAPSWLRADVPAGLEALTLHLLAKDPARRPADAAVVRELLHAAISDTSTAAAGGPAHPNPLDRLAGGAFVGREAIMADLRTTLETTITQRGAVVLLAGEAGIGKTRTTEELSTYARLRRVPVYVGRCHEGDGAPALWPWIQIVRAHADARGVEELRADLGRGAPLIAALVPELHDRLGVASAPPDPDNPETQFRLFDAITHTLRRASAREPVVLIVDDLHVADHASARLLRFLARNLGDARVLVVATLRDAEMAAEHPLARVLADVGRHATTISLGPLTRVAVGRLIELTTGESVAPALADAVHARAEGNPLFVSEIVRLLASRGPLPASSGLDDVPLPETVRMAIRGRLERVSPATRRVLDVASLLGREADVRVLADALAMAPGSVADHLDEATAARLVERPPGGGPHVRFSHVLVRDCLYEDLSTTARQHLHSTVAGALERTHRASLADHHGEIAHHHRQAATPQALRRASEHARDAGSAAGGRFAHEDAVRWFEMALAALVEHDGLATVPAPETERLDLLLALGHARMRAGRRGQGRDAFREAFGAARRLSDTTRLARAALGFCDRADRTTERDAEVEMLLDEALNTLPVSDGPLRARVLGQLAVARSYPGAPNDRLALSRDAVAMAERIGDDAALTLALSARHQALLGPDHTEERLSVASRILDLARRTGSKEHQIGGHFWRALDLLQLGDIAGTERELREYARLADELGQPFYQWQATALRTMRALADGRFDDAERLAAESAAQGQRVRSPNASLLEFVHTWTLHRERGTLATLEEPLRAFAEALPTVPAFRCGLALLYAETDRPRAARETLARLAADDFASIPRDENWLNALDECAQVCARLDDDEHAAILYDLLLPYASRVIVVSYGGAVDGPVSRYLGMLATVMERFAEAELHLERALDVASRLGARPCVAHVLGDQAALRRRRAGPGDASAAAELLAEAVAIYDELGMNVHAERARRLTADAAPSPSSGEGNRLRRLGRSWEVTFGDDVLLLPDSKGLRCLVELLRNPEQEVHVLDLYALGEAGPSPAAPTAAGTDAQLDERARREYRTRVRELRLDLEEAEACNDLGRARRAREELAVVEQALVAAFGLGGRPRRLSDPVERARKAVYNRLRTTTGVIAREHPPLARHLERSVRTGTFCCYQPERATGWRFD